MLTAAVTAEGPGTGKTNRFSFIHILISIMPGSEILGVPASEINETILFFFYRLNYNVTNFFLIKFMIWHEFITNLKM